MIEKHEAQRLVTDQFEDVALTFGGMVARQQVDDELVWELARTLARAWQRIMAGIDGHSNSDSYTENAGMRTEAHPAIDGLVRALRQEATLSKGVEVGSPQARQKYWRDNGRSNGDRRSG